MRNISLRIPEEDDDFFEMLAKTMSAKGKPVDKSKLYRDAVHDYKTRYTGEISLTELQRMQRLQQTEIDALSKRIIVLENR